MGPLKTRSKSRENEVREFPNRQRRRCPDFGCGTSDSHDAKKSISQTFAEQWWQPRVVVPYVNEFKQYGESKTIFSRMSHLTYTIHIPFSVKVSLDVILLDSEYVSVALFIEPRTRSIEWEGHFHSQMRRINENEAGVRGGIKSLFRSIEAFSRRFFVSCLIFVPRCFSFFFHSR